MRRSDRVTRKEKSTPTGKGPGCALKLLASSLVLALGTIAAFAGWTSLEIARIPYQTRIYPNVYVLGVDVGGLAPDDAADTLEDHLQFYDPGILTLSDGQRTWTIPWADAGLQPDVDATVEHAFTIGRDAQDVIALVNQLLGHHDIAPVFTVDPAAARQALETISPEVSVPPTDAVVRLEGDQFVALPGQPGWELDVDASVERLVTTVAHLGKDEPIALSFREVQPRLADATPVLAQAEAMLDCTISMSTYDVLTSETFAWTLDASTMVFWLRVQDPGDGTGPTISVDEQTVRTTLDQMAAGIGQERGFDLDEATRRVLAAFDAGGGSLDLQMTHPLRTAVVEPGDTLVKIGARYGVPPGLIAEVNPGINLNQLHIGQELAIPSQADLTPYPPVPGKKIVISIPDQRMRVYESEQLIWEWPISTGLPDSPTYTGVFQILSKEVNAYASQWDLWMPHFLAVYRAGGDTYNGIHALPILANGQRLWAGNLGSPASFGCIILGIEEGETLFNWVEIGVITIIE